jgi:predicted Fe-S protein YdhL (DUF1289 family)
LCCAEIVMPKYMPEGLNYEPMGLPTTQSNQLEPSMDVASPCVGKCSLDFFGVCRGCQRTREEITAWTRLSNSEKQQVIDRIFKNI